MYLNQGKLHVGIIFPCLSSKLKHAYVKLLSYKITVDVGSLTSKVPITSLSQLNLAEVIDTVGAVLVTLTSCREYKKYAVLSHPVVYWLPHYSTANTTAAVPDQSCHNLW